MMSKPRITLCSTLPFVVPTVMHGLIPSTYDVPAATKDEKGRLILGILHIADGYHNVLIPLSDDNAPPMRFNDPADKIASSVINDYIQASLAANWEPLETKDPQIKYAYAVPGMFHVEGRLTNEEVYLKYPTEIKQSVLNTKAWFERLIKMADDDWAKNHQYKMITDLQRHAATYLELTRDWNYNVFEAQNNVCWSCHSAIHPQAIKCAQCNAILNEVEYKKNKERFATV